MTGGLLRRAACGIVLCLSTILGGCGTVGDDAPPRTVGRDTGLDRMERLALAANRCWFKSRDTAFASFSLSPELSSFSGRPRFLLVPRGRPEAKPLLVVEGLSGSSRVSAYGPVMQTPLGLRVDADIRRWSQGSARCDA